MINLTSENFEQEVLNYDGVVLVDFWATWCGPCRMLAPTLNQIEVELPSVKICKVNIDEQPELANQYNVSGVPTILIFKNGEITERFTGLRSKKDIISRL